MPAYIFMLWCGLASGSFIFQALTDELWRVAIERSYFQAFALACAALVVHFTAKDRAP